MSDKSANPSRIELLRAHAIKHATGQEPPPPRPLVRPRVSLYDFTKMSMAHLCRHEQFKDRLAQLMKLMDEEGYVTIESSAANVLHQVEREVLHVPDQKLTKANFDLHVKAVKVHKDEALMAFAQKHVTVSVFGKFRLEHERITTAARNSRKFTVVSSDAMIESIRTLMYRANRLAIVEHQRLKRIKKDFPS